MKINFINWWENNYDKLKHEFFYKFCNMYIDNDTIISNDPDIIFCSVFGKKETIINHIKNHKNIIYFFLQVKILKQTDMNMMIIYLIMLIYH